MTQKPSQLENHSIMLTLTHYTREELENHFNELGLERFRARQVLLWIYKKKVDLFSAMTDLPAGVRSRLLETFQVSSLTLRQNFPSRDGSYKLLFQGTDGKGMESVLIPEFWPRSPLSKPYPKPETGYTQCLSTQVGCPIGCLFCASGKKGLVRQLEPSEIVSQVLLAEKFFKENQAAMALPIADGRLSTVDCQQPTADSRLPTRRIGNLVIMGMGEPLANFDAFVKALSILTAPWGLSIGLHRMTLSTVGFLDKLQKLMELKLAPNLALSLHSAIPEKRAKLIPVHFPYTLKELVDFAMAYREKTQKSVTFEHVLLSGVNDQEEDAQALGKLLAGTPIKVNLIPYNPVEGFSWKRPPHKDIYAFAQRVRPYGVWVTTRKTWGDDIAAACGQLALKCEGYE